MFKQNLHKLLEIHSFKTARHNSQLTLHQMNTESTSYMTKIIRMLDLETQRQDANTTVAEPLIGVETAIQGFHTHTTLAIMPILTSEASLCDKNPVTKCYPQWE